VWQGTTPWQAQLPGGYRHTQWIFRGTCPLVTYLSGIFDLIEATLPAIYGLSFVDDIGWWADDTDEMVVADKLSAATTA